ncbi:MAG: Re/Si-specific NAD(P)(+) transhydrogenase subunit alpha [Lactobacillaceae bacterium]|jgi:NAD(P) transhydrogenase subunit alpha|nr:Re/Si-specific NAD(P)(+) transhydrogenase subunit alpha [Lactobacillaceae bacterium]
MIIVIPKEIRENENRVASSPDVVRKLVGMGFKVRVEKNAGKNAGFFDDDFSRAGAKISASAEELYKDADIIFKLWAPLLEEEKYLKKDMIIIANFHYLNDKKMIENLAVKNVACFALNLMPRISRAQGMDILSSQSNLAGYKAVIEAVGYLPKAVPMMMTAAGTIAPTRFLILGAGVAGLQAIATAKRLGGVVYAFDVRAAVKEQVESLGGKFVEIKSEESLETSGGYAKETSKDYQTKQSNAIKAQLEKTDIVITTALIPGKNAPILIAKDMLKALPKGAIIVDMAAETGGNVEGTKNNEIVDIDGVKIIGNSNLASDLPFSASSLYAKNILNFISPMYKAETKSLEFNFTDETISKTCICKGGKLTRLDLWGENK